MTATIYQFPIPLLDAVPQPSGARLSYEGTAVEVDYREHTFDEVPAMVDEGNEEPRVYALADEVVLDLGALTPGARVELMFEPEDALAWAKQMVEAAETAIKNRSKE